MRGRLKCPVGLRGRGANPTRPGTIKKVSVVGILSVLYFPGCCCIVVVVGGGGQNTIFS